MAQSNRTSAKGEKKMAKILLLRDASRNAYDTPVYSGLTAERHTVTPVDVSHKNPMDPVRAALQSGGSFDAIVMLNLSHLAGFRPGDMSKPGHDEARRFFTDVKRAAPDTPVIVYDGELPHALKTAISGSATPMVNRQHEDGPARARELLLTAIVDAVKNRGQSSARSAG